jgi:hypothetical protein
MCVKNALPSAQPKWKGPQLMKIQISRPWKIAIALGFMVAIALRFVWPEDMDYFGDQRWTFQVSQSPFWDPAKTWVENGLGIGSSVGLLSPGMTWWIFQILAKLFSVHHPIGLSLLIRASSVLALSILLFFILKIVAEKEREPWLWGWLLMAVNPFELLFQRRVWPPCFLYPFMALFLVGWWKREKNWGTFLFALSAALMSQLHMLIALLYASFLGWGWMNRKTRPLPRLKPWIAATILGAIPAIPWIVYFVHALQTGQNTGDRVWAVASQLRFWRYWITQPFGLLLTYTLEPGGYFREFLHFPSLAGHSTFLVAALHAAAGACCCVVTFLAARAGFNAIRTSSRAKSLEPLKTAFWGKSSETDAALQAGFWGFGLLMTAKTFYIYRHYLIATAPLQLTWAATYALRLPSRWGRRLLAALVAIELGISVCFLVYIQVNGGAPGAEYGHTFRRQVEIGHWTQHNDPHFFRDVYQPEPLREPIPFEKIPEQF